MCVCLKRVMCGNKSFHFPCYFYAHLHFPSEAHWIRCKHLQKASKEINRTKNLCLFIYWSSIFCLPQLQFRKGLHLAAIPKHAICSMGEDVCISPRKRPKENHTIKTTITTLVPLPGIISGLQQVLWCAQIREILFVPPSLGFHSCHSLRKTGTL